MARRSEQNSRRTSKNAGVAATAFADAVESPITVQFQVHMKSDVAQKAYPFEARGNHNRVYVVGDDASLGEWKPVNAVPMIRTAKATSTKDVGVVWSADVSFPGPRRFQYRYFIGRPSPAFEGSVIIIQWEAFPAPRSHQLIKLAKAEEKHGFVVINDTYGEFGANFNCDGGWLSTQIELRLSFLKNPIRWWKKRHQGLKYFMKITATDPKGKSESSPGAETSASTTSLDDHATMREEHEGTLGPVTHAILSETSKNKEKQEIETQKKTGYSLQDQFGVELFPDENIIFRSQSEEPKNLYFTIDFFAADHPMAKENAPYYAGTSHILFANFVSEDSLVTAPIFGRYSHPIGEVSFKYLVIRPLQQIVLTMAKSRFAHYAPGATGNDPLDIAHRGMGNSYTEHEQQLRENTITSIKEAARCGADMVECDVQLTKDGVAVVYHDFDLKVNLRKRVLDNMNDEKDANFELSTLAVKDLTLKQLQSLQTYHKSVEEFGPRDWRTDPTAANADEPEESLPFPTLEKVLQVLDPKVGLNLEIKYPQFIDRGDDKLEHELVHFYDRNNYLDTILETLLRHSGDRRILISCFDSDACIMLKKKQCVFPVIFLTQGQTQKYPPYKDFRTLSIPAAIKFACAEQLVGICVHSEDLLREASMISEVKRAGLALFCWGEANNKRDNIQYLKSQGVDGIICNRINELINPAKAAEKAAEKAAFTAATTAKLTKSLIPGLQLTPAGSRSPQLPTRRVSVGKGSLVSKTTERSSKGTLTSKLAMGSTRNNLRESGGGETGSYLRASDAKVGKSSYASYILSK